MSGVAFHQETDPLGMAEEIIGDGILVNRVNPGADEGDFLGTNVPVEIDLAIPVPVIHEEANVTDSAVFPDIAGRCGNSRALEGEMGAVPPGGGFDRSGSRASGIEISR